MEKIELVLKIYAHVDPLEKTGKKNSPNMKDYQNQYNIKGIKQHTKIQVFHD